MIVGAFLFGRYFPIDLIRCPPGYVQYAIPHNIRAIACHGVTRSQIDEQIPFSGHSSYGRLWSWRRGLSAFDGMNIGRRDYELEILARDQEACGYIVYEAEGTTAAIIYSRRGSANTGSIGGNFICYEKDSAGQWHETASYYDYGNSLDQSILRLKTTVISTAVGLTAALLWNFHRTRKRNAYKALHRAPHKVRRPANADAR